MKVWNKRQPGVPGTAVYVGRGSPWGNPYSHRQGTQALWVVGSRDEAIQHFRVYAEQRLMGDPHWLDALRGRDLVCWCTPQSCHAEVLLELANS